MREAARILGVSNAKIWRLVRDGVLATSQNPLDRREKLIRRDDLERLGKSFGSHPGFRSDGCDTDPVNVPARHIKEWVRATWHRD